jgi:hypothetical protein
MKLQGRNLSIEMQGEEDCIGVKFSEGLVIFDDNCGYPVIDDQEKYN